MRFKNYCIVIMGRTDGAMREIIGVAEQLHGTMDAKGVLIVTFASSMEASEITAFFKSTNRNFVVFDIDKKYSGYNFMAPNVMEELFGGIVQISMPDPTIDINTVMDVSEDVTYSGTPSIIAGSNRGFKTQPKLTDEDIRKLTLKEKQEKINSIIDKGWETLTDDDKEILKKLTEN